MQLILNFDAENQIKDQSVCKIDSENITWLFFFVGEYDSQLVHCQ